ncbi:MAG TPA: translation initiation factor IF-2 [Abditibacteriaceae bacterium]
MAKMRVYDLAKELQVQPKELLELLKTIGVSGKVPSSSIEDTAARSLRQMIENKNNPQAAVAAVAAPAPATPTAFENFRASGRRAAPAVDTNDVSSDVIEDYREQAQPEGDFITQGPAKSGPGARSDAGRYGSARPADNRPAPSRPAPPRPVENRPATPTPAAASTSNGSANGSNGAATVNGSANGAAPAAPAAPPQRDSGRFQGRGGRRDFRGGPRRDDRFRGASRFGDRNHEPAAPEPVEEDTGDKKLTLPPEITISELADKIRQPVATLIKKLFMMNIVRAGNQAINADVAGQLLAQFGYTMEVETARPETHVLEEEQGELVPVPPVVTIMGHVDHGKTSLLDIIRSANVQSGEAGGITQRIGAYETEHNGERIVFLDTPGHEAFTRMRARGAHVTDIAILVVAADDGVMPQTREAIDHARAAKVPIIVAMNKMDRAEADPDRVKGELAQLELIPEDYGGDTIVIPVSAKTGQGVQDLLDMVLIVAELQELKANPDGPASGTVIEAQQDNQRGPVATVLVHRGTLRVGDHVVVGDVFGRVRAMNDYKGESLQEAGPKRPVSVMGLSAVPHASDTLRAVGSSREAREQAEAYAQDAKQGRYLGTGRISLDELFTQIQKGAAKELNVIVKADVQGSVEAMCQSLEKLAHDEVRVKIVSRGAGNVTESDVMLASASGAIIIAFSVGVEHTAASLADREKIEIRQYKVIYDAINEVKAALEGMLEAVFEERLSGEAEVRATFRSTKAGVIAGCLVTSGKLVQGSVLRVWRRGNKVFDGKIDSLKHVKENVKEMVAGQECGVSSNRFDDFQEGDILQSIVMQGVKRDIEARRPETAVVGPPQKR